MRLFRYVAMVCVASSITFLLSPTVGQEVSAVTEGIVFDGARLEVDYPTFLARHDVVYLTPAANGYEGFPIGNGDLGAMAWTPPDNFFFQINKINTWDDAPEGIFSPWEDAGKPEKSERFTSLRSCGEFRIEPGLPVLDWTQPRTWPASGNCFRPLSRLLESSRQMKTSVRPPREWSRTWLSS